MKYLSTSSCGEAEGLEDLRAGVRRDGGDAHLGHHLQHALAQRLHQVGDRLLRLLLDVEAVAREVLDGLHREVGVDRGGAVPDQQWRRGAPRGRRRPRPAGRPGCGSSRAPGGGARPRSSAATGSAPWWRRSAGRRARSRGRRSAIASLTSSQISSRRAARAVAAAADVVEAAGDVGDEAGHVAVTVDVPDLDQLVVGDHRERQHHLAARRGRRGRAGWPPGPMVPLRLVTSSSRIASSGGLVTWANSCAK